MRSFDKFCLLVVMLLIGGRTFSADDLAQQEKRQAELDARVQVLIEQLGSTEFPVREKAQRELIQIGLAAFDALQEAQFHPDLEIGLRARYLIGSANIAWSRDDDPPEVKSILKDYSTQNEAVRKTRIDKLAKLENRLGWPALCRLARYEKEEWLSKVAAIAILEQELPAANDTEAARSMVQLGAGQSRRQAAAWLRAYARTLSEPDTVVAEWTRFVEDEFEVWRKEPARSSEEVAKSLGRWHAATLKRLGHDPELQTIVKRLEELVAQSTEKSLEEKLQEHVDWLGHSEMWPQVLDLQGRYGETFARRPMLLYRLAEAQRKSGDAETALKSAQAALALNADDATGHVKAGQELAERGLFDWAEAEYRYVQNTQKINTPANVWSRYALAEMLHDHEKEREAAEVLQAIADELGPKKDPFGKAEENPMRQLLDGMGREPGSLLSRMHYFYALDHLHRKELPEAVKRLEDGIQEDPSDADVLIALYRLPNRTQEQTAETRRRIKEAADGFQTQITEYTRNLAQLQGQVPPEALEGYKRQVAMAHNQMAWLISNTEGDFDAAVASSHESLKLVPGQPAYLDTLGRCYYAKGDLANAIKYQNEAVRKEPHSATMKRQLAFFKAEAGK